MFHSCLADFSINEKGEIGATLFIGASVLIFLQFIAFAKKYFTNKKKIIIIKSTPQFMDAMINRQHLVFPICILSFLLCMRSIFSQTFKIIIYKKSRKTSIWSVRKSNLCAAYFDAQVYMRSIFGLTGFIRRNMLRLFHSIAFVTPQMIDITSNSSYFLKQ